MTNLAIKRDLMKFCRNRKIPCSNYMGLLRVDGCVVYDHTEGYIGVWLTALNDQRIDLLLEYTTPTNWYKKFCFFRNCTTVVYRENLKQTVYAKKQEVMVNGVSRLLPVGLETKRCWLQIKLAGVSDLVHQ